MSTLQQLSIIIPFAPEDTAWQVLLPDLKNLPSTCEIILVAGSEKSRLEASSLQMPVKAILVEATMGRASQMNAGACLARNPCLWFLHADSRVDIACFKAIESFDVSKKQLAYFGLRFQNDGPARMGINSFGVWFRSRFLGIPFGDQGFLVSKSCFEMLGGYREDLSSGEDHALVWAARKSGIQLVPLNASIHTSARKYAEHGWGKTTRMHLRETWRQAREFSKQAKPGS